MHTEHLKAQIHKGAQKIDPSVEATAEKAANGADALGRKHADVQDSFGDLGQCFRDSARGFSKEVEKQARLHPLATFGFAFAAGLIVARALRR